MNDDARALLACTDPSRFGRTLLFDLDDIDLRESLAEVEVRTTTPTADRDVATVWQPADEPFATVVLTVPKSRPRLRMLLALAASLVRDDGRLILVAHKRGAGGAETDLAAIGGVERLGSKAHRRILSTRVAGAAPFLIDEWVHEASIETPDGPMPVAWLPGVFAEGHLDAGTELLLHHLPEHAERHLDIGTGCGVLGVSMAARGPGPVLGIERDVFAVEATRRTMRLNAVPGTVIWAESPTAAIGEGDALVDLAISNPPFHDGLERTTATTEQLLRDTATILTPGGELRIVANRFLPYERTLAVAFDRHELLGEDARYRVWRAWQPSSAG